MAVLGCRCKQDTTDSSRVVRERAKRETGNGLTRNPVIFFFFLVLSLKGQQNFKVHMLSK